MRMLKQSSDEMGSRGSQDESEETSGKKDSFNDSSGGSFENVDEHDSNDESLKTGISLPQLETWSVQDLKRLSEDPEIIDAMVMASPLVVALENKKSQLVNENTQISIENLACEKTMASLLQELNSNHDRIKNLLQQVEYSSASYSKLAEAYSPNNIRESLKTSVCKIDEESEKIAEDFLKGGVDVEEFIGEYTEKRKLSHIRKIKCEKLGNQLKKIEQAGL